MSARRLIAALLLLCLAALIVERVQLQGRTSADELRQSSSGRQLDALESQPESSLLAVDATIPRDSIGGSPAVVGTSNGAGEIHVTLVVASEAAVDELKLSETLARIEVLLERNEHGEEPTVTSRARPNDEGVAVFSGVPEGAYSALVNLPHNPLGLVVGRSPSPNTSEGAVQEFVAPLMLSTTTRRDYEFYLYAPSSIEVHVPVGSVDGGEVGLRCIIPGYNQGEKVLRVGSDGVALFEAVVPGSYRCSFTPAEQVKGVEQRGREALFLSEGVLSRPLDVDVAPGEAAVVYIDGGLGSASVEGRAVTNLGTVLVGVDVLLYHKEEAPELSKAPLDMRDVASLTRTDADGKFRFDSLPATTFGLQVAPKGHLPGKRPSENLLVRPIENRTFTLRPEERRDEGDITAYLSRPVSVVGEIVLPAWTDERRDELLRAVQLAAFKTDPQLPSPGRIRSGFAVEMGDDGAFEVFADAAFDTVYLRFRGSHPIEGEVVFPIQLTSEDTLDIGPVSFP